MNVTVRDVLVGDPAEAWRRAGFDVGDDGVCLVGPLPLRLCGRESGKGVLGWSLDGVPHGVQDVDGIAVLASDGGATSPAPAHPNGVVGIDHLVLLTPDLSRTVQALADLGLEPRRHRDGDMGGTPVRQVFYRLGAVILEVVGDPEAHGAGPASLWGITFTVADLDATAALLGEGVGRVKDAVQPGRRIATLRHKTFDITVATAFISAKEPAT